MKLTTELNYHPHNLDTAELKQVVMCITWTDPTNAILKCTLLALNALISGKF